MEEKGSFGSKKGRHNNIIDVAQQNNFISQIPVKHENFAPSGFMETAVLTWTISKSCRSPATYQMWLNSRFGINVRIIRATINKVCPEKDTNRQLTGKYEA